LLLATSNGQGGGDYYGINSELCGSWLNDDDDVDNLFPVISVEGNDYNVSNLTEFDVMFKERDYF
jgi:hypothetical protein